MPLFLTIVLDGVGIGAQDDASDYGDEGSHTLAHVCAAAAPDLPNLTKLGLGCIAPLDGVPPVDSPLASFGRMQEVSAGKDSTTGHWELAGLHLERPFPTYPDGFPNDLIQRFLDLTGCDGILGNRPASGTAIVAELGDEHRRTGRPIVYTSADSVFQIAAHKDVVPLEELYRLCRVSREEVCVGEHAVGRVIARPFIGESGAYRRVSGERKDFSIKPSSKTVQEILQEQGARTISVGKIYDLFGGVGFDDAYKTSSNSKGLDAILSLLRDGEEGSDRFIWANLVDFDQEFGHRNDPAGFARALEEFDRALPEILRLLPDESRLLITADHGNDPTTPSTDHSREYVPVLFFGGREVRNVGLRDTFADHAATVADYFGTGLSTVGSSFLH